MSRAKARAWTIARAGTRDRVQPDVRLKLVSCFTAEPSVCV